MRLPRLYAIVDAGTLEARRLALEGFVSELAGAGITLVQYRDKLGTGERVLQNARKVAEAFRGLEATLVMNDSPELAFEAGWRAVHVGQGDARVGAARAVLGREAMVGASTHNDQQVIEADRLGADYIAIGPIFATSTKADHEPVVGLEGVRRARALTQRPLVAIGGITAENAGAVIEAGADTVAVIGALLCNDATPAEMVRRFLEAMPK